MLSNRNKILTVFFIIFFIAAFSASAQNATRSPKITMVDKKLIDGNKTYNFKIGEYNPIVLVKFLKKENADYSTPEKTLVTHLSAMQSLDYKWFRKSWDKKSIDMMDQQEKKAIDIKTKSQHDKQGQTSEQKFLNAWEKLKNRPHFLNLKAEINYQGNNYVLIGWTADLGNEKGPFNFVPMYKKGKRWYLTQDLREHPVYVNLVDIAAIEDKVINIERFKQKDSGGLKFKPVDKPKTK